MQDGGVKGERTRPFLAVKQITMLWGSYDNYIHSTFTYTCQRPYDLVPCFVKRTVSNAYHLHSRYFKTILG